MSAPGEALHPLITVLITDDHPVVRSGLRVVLDAAADLSVVGEAATGEAAVSAADRLRPDVVLCDLRLGEGIDGIATTAALRRLDPPPAVVILTTFDRDAEVIGAIEAGAAGYLLKDAAPAEITAAIRQAAAGRLALSPDLAARVLNGLRTPIPRLTAREIEVLRLVESGAGNAEIAGALFVSEATVKSHLVHVFTKLGVDSRVRAVSVARQIGLI